ncbi:MULTISPECIES: hypothetical protein [Brevibacterium]|uniref:DUF2975 domain-containing protein n=1 Tax=Brevibacterium casei TaxID=33889 RepID=A0A7T4A1T2_9MICO|nr:MULTISPECIES: hypothetical protein [Brevibacterium]QQB15716.1 hypothetical protein I6H47_07295 [Brevibacterium casei]
MEENARRREPDERKGLPAGGVFLIAFAPGIYAVYLIGLFVAGIVRSEITVRFDLSNSDVASLDLAGHSANLSGLTQVTLSTGDLATETMVFLIIAKLSLVLTLLGAAVALVPVVRAISAGNPFTPAALRALGVLNWVLMGGIITYFISTTLGTNLASRDLNIADEVGSSASIAQTYVIVGIVGVIELLRRSFVSGRKAQEELEGLV